MPPRRRLALALLLGGALLGIAVQQAAPTDLEAVLGKGKAAPLGLAIARGPPHVKLDGATTLLSFGCSHQNCATAVRMEGDQTALASEHAVLLRGGSWDRATLSPEWTLATGPGFLQNVTSVVVEPVREVPRWPFLAAAGAAIVALAAGAALLSRKLPPAGAVEAGATSLVGYALVLRVQSLYTLEPAIPLYGAALLALVIGALVLAFARASSIGRLAGWGFLAFALGIVVGDVLAGPYYPSCCQM